MKIAFSTIGCPGWSFGDIVSAAKDLNFDGVEIRGIGKEMYAPHCVQFSENNLASTKKVFGDKLKISCLATDICLGSNERKEASLKEAEDYLALATKLNVPNIRVMISNHPYPEETDIDFALNMYKTICCMAEKLAPDTSVLVETNGVLADTAVMRSFIENSGKANGGVLWDIHHPRRFFDESIDRTVKNIGGYVKYLHVKDSVQKDGRVEYRMMGYGDMPVLEALQALEQCGYDGYVSLEWVKRWLPDLQEPGIVFSQYISYMNYLLKLL